MNIIRLVSNAIYIYVSVTFKLIASQHQLSNSLSAFRLQSSLMNIRNKFCWVLLDLIGLGTSGTQTSIPYQLTSPQGGYIYPPSKISLMWSKMAKKWALDNPKTPLHCKKWVFSRFLFIVIVFSLFWDSLQIIFGGGVKCTPPPRRLSFSENSSDFDNFFLHPRNRPKCYKTAVNDI